MESRVQALLLASGLALGIVLGREGISPPGRSADLLLLLLVFLVGAEAGSGGRRLRGLAVLGAVMGAATVAFSALGAGIAGLLLSMDPALSAAVGAGSGWYSMTGPLLGRAAGPFWGYLGLAANLARELLTLLLYPLVPRRLSGPAIALGGATTMDTTLPLMASRGLGAAAFAHGLVATLLAPPIVAALASLSAGG